MSFTLWSFIQKTTCISNLSSPLKPLHCLSRSIHCRGLESLTKWLDGFSLSRPSLGWLKQWLRGAGLYSDFSIDSKSPLNKLSSTPRNGSLIPFSPPLCVVEDFDEIEQGRKEPYTVCELLSHPAKRHTLLTTLRSSVLEDTQVFIFSPTAHEKLWALSVRIQHDPERCTVAFDANCNILCAAMHLLNKGHVPLVSAWMWPSLVSIIVWWDF